MNDGDHGSISFILAVSVAGVVFVSSVVGFSIVFGVCGGVGAGSAHTSFSRVVIGGVAGVGGGVGDPTPLPNYYNCNYRNTPYSPRPPPAASPFATPPSPAILVPTTA